MTDDETKHFCDFANEKRHKVEDFISMWIESHAKEPKQYPLRMNPGDWDEQFAMFENIVDGADTK